MNSALESLGPSTNENNEQLSEFEFFWRDHCVWLKERGYLLRQRYRPGWVASWIGTNKRAIGCEDFLVEPLFRFNMDAIRISDNKPVMLRRPDPPSVSDEHIIVRLLSSEGLRSDRRNHCVPIYDTMEIPDADGDGRNLLAVMPFLVDWDKPDFITVGEVVDFCSQVFEGMQFMHNLSIAHNDTKNTNLMMDWSPLYSSPPHSIRTSMKMDWSGPSMPRNRTLHPVKYYFIDWDLSKHYDTTNGPPLQKPGYGGDQSVPEFERNEPCDPFAVDVYCLGNVIRQKFILGNPRRYANPPRRNVEFLEDLIFDMTHNDPKKRPTINEVVSRFEVIRKRLSWWKLRSRVSSKKTPLVLHLLYSPAHWAVQLGYILRRIPAIPDYTSRGNS